MSKKSKVEFEPIQRAFAAAGKVLEGVDQDEQEHLILTVESSLRPQVAKQFTALYKIMEGLDPDVRHHVEHALNGAFIEARYDKMRKENAKKGKKKAG